MSHVDHDSKTPLTSMTIGANLAPSMDTTSRGSLNTHMPIAVNPNRYPDARACSPPCPPVPLACSEGCCERYLSRAPCITDKKNSGSDTSHRSDTNEFVDSSIYTPPDRQSSLGESPTPTTEFGLARRRNNASANAMSRSSNSRH